MENHPGYLARSRKWIRSIADEKYSYKGLFGDIIISFSDKLTLINDMIISDRSYPPLYETCHFSKLHIYTCVYKIINVKSGLFNLRFINLHGSNRHIDLDNFHLAISGKPCSDLEVNRNKNVWLNEKLLFLKVSDDSPNGYDCKGPRDSYLLTWGIKLHRIKPISGIADETDKQDEDYFLNWIRK